MILDKRKKITNYEQAFIAKNIIAANATKQKHPKVEPSFSSFSFPPNKTIPSTAITIPKNIIIPMGRPLPPPSSSE